MSRTKHPSNVPTARALPLPRALPNPSVVYIPELTFEERLPRGWSTLPPPPAAPRLSDSELCALVRAASQLPGRRVLGVRLAKGK